MLFESDWKSGWSLNFSMHVHVMLIMFLLDSCFIQVIYICVCEMKMLQQASKRTFRFNRSLALDVRIEIHRQGRCQPEQPCQKARFFGMISLKSTG